MTLLEPEGSRMFPNAGKLYVREEKYPQVEQRVDGGPQMRTLQAVQWCDAPI